MQPLVWYVRRLRAMSSAEVLGRARAAARDGADATRHAIGLRPSSPAVAALAALLATPAPPRLCDVAPGEWRKVPRDAPERAWHDRLIAAANELLAHRLPVFDEVFDLGSPIVWNRDHALGKDTPRGFAAWIDYRDLRTAGDAKIVWEPNRHLHLPVLARAYRATGDVRYAAEIVRQWESWLDQCPFPTGMNWRSPLELAVRLLNWIWSLDAIRDAGVLTPAFASRLMEALYLHVWDVARKFSSGSSANNHLIGEAAGVFAATCYFPELDPGGGWREQSARILTGEILRQTAPDGGTREQALGYQLFVLQLLLAAGLFGRKTGHELPASFWTRLEAMLAFVCRLVEAGPLPMVGDADDGYALDFGRDRDDDRSLLAVGAVLFDRPDFARVAGEVKEPLRWWLGAGAPAAFASRAAGASGPLSSHAFPDTGYYLLQAGTSRRDGISVLFDCAPLGFTELAAHGHADALSIVVRAFGRDVLVDPGTYDYFSHPEWRDYFRGTRAHNTLEIDGRDQSEQYGLFLWGAKAEAGILDWTVDGGVTTAAGRHDGYRRLDDPVTHERSLRLDGARRELVVRDTVQMTGRHDVRLFFHCAEDCDVVSDGAGRWVIQVGTGRATLTLDARLHGRVERGSEAPIAGWVSRAYHRRRPAPVIVGEALAVTGPASFECRLEFEPCGAA